MGGVDVFGYAVDAARGGVHAIDRKRMLLLGPVAFVIAADAIGRVGEPDAAVGVHGGVIGRIQRPAFVTVGDDRDRTVVFVPHDAAAAVLAGDLPALGVKGIAVAVPGRVAEFRHMAVVFEPAHLPVVGYVTPDQVAADAAPGRAFRPQGAGVVTPDRRVEKNVRAKTVVERHQVRVWIAQGSLARPVTRRRRRQILLASGQGGQHGGACQRRAEKVSSFHHSGIDFSEGLVTLPMALRGKASSRLTCLGIL